VISAESLINAPAAWKYKKKMKRNSNSWRPLPFSPSLSFALLRVQQKQNYQSRKLVERVKKNNRKKSSKCLKNNNKKEGGQKANYTNNGEQF